MTNDNKETVIDFDNLPENESQIRFDIDPKELKKNPKAQEEDEDNELDTDADADGNYNFGDDFEVDLDDSGEDDIEDVEEAPKKAKKQKEEPKKPKNDVEEQEAKRKSGAQERIRELANKNRAALEEKLALEAKNKEIEQELLQYKKKSAVGDVSVAEKELNEAKYGYAKAYEEGDAVAIAEANSKLSQASMKVELARLKKNQTDTLTFDEDKYTKRLEESKAEMARNSQDINYEDAPKIDPKAEQWLKRNKFIFTNQELTQTAGILFDQLKDDGYDVTEYDTYEELQDRMLSIYPNLDKMFKRKVKNQETEEMDEVAETPKPKQTPPPVANASRTQAVANQSQMRVDSKGKIKYKPTREDVDMARRMDITLENYVKNKLLVERNEANGSKYTQIF